MKTDVDTCLIEIADWYVKNRRQINVEALHSILAKHCEDEADIEKFVKFLETAPGQVRFKTHLRGRKAFGTCYEDAWRFLIKEEEGELIHGTVFSGGRRIGHAWVELPTGYIWEPETGGYSRLGFEDAFAPVRESRYTAEEAAIMAARTKNFGPWTEQERKQYLEASTLKETEKEETEETEYYEQLARKLWPAASDIRIKELAERLKATKKRKEAPSELRETTSHNISQLRPYTGKAYRVDIPNWGIPREATAADIVRFEQQELGNDLGVSDELIKLLENYDHTDVVWVTKNKVDAEYYLSEGMTKADITEVDLGKGARIVAEDQQGGFLVLCGDAKPKRKEAPSELITRVSG